MKAIATRLKLNRSISVLLVVFIALAFFYSVIIPIFEGPDEDDHFRYAKYLADQRAFPVQLFEPGGGIAGHQGWQPPLYYSLAALIITPIDTSDYEQQLWRNYAATFVGDPACCGRNIYYHPDSQNFPWTRTTLAVHLARLLSIFFGAVTVGATYLIVQSLTNRSSRISNLTSLAAASIVAFNPSFLFASGLFSNDAPLAAFCALALLVWVKFMVGQSALSTKSAAMLGTLIGLALLTKTTAVGLIPFSILVFFVTGWRARAWRTAIISSAVMLIVIILVSGWWFIRNTMIYGDLLAYRLMIMSAIFPRAGPLTLPELFQISLPWLWQTFWGGPTPGDFSPVFLIILAVLSAIALVGTTVFLFRRLEFATRASVLVLGMWLVFILVAQIQFIQTTTGADQGRYLFPAISVIALFLVVGLEYFTHPILHITRWSLAHLLIPTFFALALFVPFAYTLPAYARPGLLSESDAQKIAQPFETTFADQFQLLGYDLETRAVKPGETLRVTLYWRAIASMPESYRVFVHLIGQENRIAGGSDVIPARGAFPTVYWKPGDTLRDRVAITIDANALPGKYAIEVGVYPVGKPGERLTTQPGDDRVLISAIKISPSQAVAYTPQRSVNANFDNQIELTGYDWNTPTLTLYWRAVTRVDTEYKIFIHVLDANGKIISQIDRQPQDGNYPTSIWNPNEQVRDEYSLTLPNDAKQLAIGLYRVDDEARLRVLNTNGNADFILLNLSR